MPCKRKRGLEGKEDTEDSPGPSQQPAKKKKKPLQYDPQEICQELYDTIRNAKSEEGHLLCEAFIRVPKRRTAADYYDVVTTPIDLLKIQQKLKTDEYDDIDLLTNDVQLMINNAKAYYKEDSQEYQDACELWEIYEEVKAELLEETFGELSDHCVNEQTGNNVSQKGNFRSDSDLTDVDEFHGDEGTEDDATGSLKVEKMEMDELQEHHHTTHQQILTAKLEVKEEDEEMEEGAEKSEAETSDSRSDIRHDENEEYEQLFAAVMTAREGDRNLSEIFQLLPSRSKYPEYYEIIRAPIDLKTIAVKIQEGKYQHLDELERDLNLMVRNAQTYNDPKSIIFKDACTLKKIITAKKQELEYKRSGMMKTSERLRSRERTNVQRLSAVCAALKYQSEDDDTASSQMEFEGDSDMEDGDSPFWALYCSVKDYKNADGDSLSQPFCKLPSKKFYPDYYKEIRKPMSLYNVRKKIKTNQYQTLRECAIDINLIFENARKYNQDESKIYKDACELQKVLIEKKREIDKEGVVDEAPLIVTPFPGLREGREEEDIIPTSKPKGRKSDPEGKKKPPKKTPEDCALKKRLNILYKTAHEYTDVNGRVLRTIFMGLPSRKDYPDYYQVIMEPIDMTMIETKIKTDKYPNEQALLCDFELMFNNARHYNEEGSVVYQDADMLDRILRAKWRNMSQSRTSSSKRSRSKSTSPMSQKLQDLYESVRDFQDKAGRALSTPFIKLPLKSDYPDYYEVIKKPMDMQRIQQKLLTGQYDNVEDMVADFVQMFDNACKYNEPESVIYKDALTLQRVVFEKKMELIEGTNDVPDVKALVQELIRNLFISTYNAQDDEGRCYSDAFAELPELIERAKMDDDNEEPSERLLTFDQIKRNIDRGRYRRMDRFQDDMFKVFERARKASRTDSQLYEDAVEMQMLFIKARDELCKNGELLLTPALSYTEKHLQVALETEKREKLPQEQKEEEEKKRSGGDTDDKGEDGRFCQEEPSENEIIYKDQTYMVGDFVYIEPREMNLEPHIMMIEKFNTDESGARMIKGFYFYRPNETYHLATRKFLEKEVFKTEQSHEIAMAQIMGRCYVMFVKDYFKMKPEGIPDKDVYVCESRYSIRNRCFKKIKIWQSARSNINFVPRDVPLVPIRVQSVFASKVASEAKEQDDGDISLLDKTRINVLSEVAPEDGNIYYDQYVHSSGCLKLGDCVYVRSDRDYPLIARIDKLWTTAEGDAYFHGCWFVRPSEIEHAPTRLFYKREVFLSSIEDTNPLGSVISKCCVLHIKDYCSSRPTEIPEFDVYICESKYHELERSIKKLGKGLKKHTLSPKVTDDEVYFFRKPIALQKMFTQSIPMHLQMQTNALFISNGYVLRDLREPKLSVEFDIKWVTQEPSPLLMKVPDDQTSYLETESVRDAEGDAASENLSASVEETTPVPEKPAKRKNASNRRQPSGYIVFAGEIRKSIQNENPESSFGDISRIVGMKWRSLSKEEKEVFEERAKKIADEMAAKQQEADRAFNDSMQRSQSPWSDTGHTSPGSSARPGTPGSYPPGFNSPYPAGYPPTPGGPFPGQYPCPPNPSLTPQTQPGGVNGVSLQSSMYPHHLHHPGSSVQHMMGPPYQQFPFPQGQTSPHPPGMHLYPNLSPMSSHASSPGASPMLPGSPQGLGVMTGQAMSSQPARPPSPMFVTVPPRTQRLLHSEAYLKYIEGLNVETRSISNFPKLLAATPDNTPVPSEARLPTQWLAQGAGYHGSIANALWALRDLMLKDTMTMAKTIPFEDL